jgi:hypothetical protein
MASYLPNSKVSYPDPVLYTPDFSYIDKMLRRRQSMYEQGFAQVAGKYNALNKEMTHTANQQFRDQFLKQANENLKNLSAMDLSLPQNVQAASSVFAPFYKNTLAMQDLGFTAKVNSELQRAEADRDRENGKFYNAASVQLINRMKEEFRNDSPESVGYYANSVPGYRHYVDYSKTIMEAYEKFKPSERNMEYINGEWIVTEKTSMTDPLEFRRLLDATLSQQEKDQMAIEGMARYGRQPEVLTQLYTNDIAAADAQINKLNQEKQLAKTAEEKADIENKITYYNNFKTNKMTNLQRLSDPDKYRARAAADSIAADFYTTEVINRAGALRKPSQTRELKINDVWKTKYEWSQKWAQQEDQQQHEMDKVMLEASLGKGKGRDGKSGDLGGALTGSSATLNASEATGYGAEGLERDIAAAEQAMKDADQEIAAALIAQNIPVNTESVAAFKNKYSDLSTDILPVYDDKGKFQGNKYRSTGKWVEPQVMQQLEAFNRYTQRLAPAMITKNTLTSYRDQLTGEVKSKIKTEDYSKAVSLLSSIPSVRVKDNNGVEVTITPVELFDQLMTGLGKVELPSKNSYTGFSINDKLVYKGREFSLPITDPASNSLRMLISAVEKAMRSDSGKKVTDIAKSVYESSRINNPSLALVDVDSDFYKQKLGEAKQLMGGADVEIRGLDVTGGRLAVSFKKQDEDTKNEIIERTKGRADIVYDEANDLFFIGGLAGVGITDQYTSTQQAIIKAASTPFKGVSKGNNMYSLEGSPVKLNNLPYDFTWKRTSVVLPGTDGTQLVLHTFNVYSGLAPNEPLPISREPITSPFQLAEAFGKLESNPVLTSRLVESIADRN